MLDSVTVKPTDPLQPARPSYLARKTGSCGRLKSVRNDVATRFVRHLRLEFDAIIDRTLSIANAATFRHQRKGGQLVTVLELTDEQRAAAEETHERLIRWASAVVSFLRRRGAEGDAEIEQLAVDLTPCVTLQWRDRDDVPERQWRTKLHRELMRVSAEAARHLGTCTAEEARGMALEPKPFSPFPLRIEAIGQRHWRVCAGELATERMTFPKHFEFPPLSPERIEPFGRALFDLVFAGKVGEAFQRARAQGNLRIQLDTREAGALHSLRWELLHDGDQFLGLSTRVSLSRHVAATEPGRSTAFRLPLRLLLMVSAPPDVALLDGAREQATLEAALAPLTMSGLVEIDVVAGSSFGALRRRLRAAANAGRPHHVWHFIGHGGDDALVMTDDTGGRRDVSSAELETLFKEHPTLALVVLNSCDGVQFHDDGTTSGIAAALLSCGAPAIVAMQEPISDPAAILLAEELYGALSDGAVLDTALIEARRAIFFQPNQREWHIPVLLMAVE